MNINQQIINIKKEFRCMIETKLCKLYYIYDYFYIFLNKSKY